MENSCGGPDVEIVYDFNDVKVEPKPTVISRNVGSPEYINVDEDSEEEITCLGTYTSSKERPQNIQPSEVKVEEGPSSKLHGDFNQCTLESGSKETSNTPHLREESKDNIKNISVPKQNVSLPSLEENSVLGKKPIGKTQQFTHEIPSNANQAQKAANSRDLFQNNTSPLSSQRAVEVSNARELEGTIIAVQNSVSNPKTVQQKYGNELKHQIKRFVTFPVKYNGVNFSTQIANNASAGGKIIRIVKPNVINQPVNKNISKGDLSCSSNTGKPEIPKVHENSAMIKTIAQGPSVGTSNTRIVFVKKNANEILKSVKDNTTTQTPPAMLLLNNRVIKLKGIKNHEPQLQKNSNLSAEIKKQDKSDVPLKCAECGAEQCCQMRKSTKSFAEQSTQTKIYSWIYKNSKLYTFVDDEGTQVEIEPLKTVRVETQRKETNVPSPVSSLDNESECSDDEILVTDEPSVNNSSLNKHHTAQNSFANVNYVGSNTQNNTSCLEPQNVYQEILNTHLGLNNKAQEPIDSICPVFDPLNHQNQYEQETANINTVYNHELQRYVPCSENKRLQPVSEQPAVVDPAFQRSNPVTSDPGNTALADLFKKLVQDIKTCLCSDALGNIPLHQAAISNDLVKLKSQCIVLKTIKSHLDHINLAHETALMVAVRLAVETKDYEAVSVLVAEGADQRVADMQGNTPLHHAVRRGCDQLVRVLLSGAHVDTVTQKFNYDGFTPLHIAAMEGYDEVIKLLVGTNIDINIKDRKNGRTPYFLAVREKKRTSAQLLKMFGADVNEPNFADLAPLVFASPEKSLVQRQRNEENADDTGISEPAHVDQLEKEKVPDVSRLPQTFWTDNESFVFIDNKYDGLDPPSLLSSGNDMRKDIERVERTSESFDANDLCSKYEKTPATTKLISKCVEPVALLYKRKLVKAHEKIPLAQNESISENHHQNQSHYLSEKNSSVGEFESQPSFNSNSTFRDNNRHNEYDINENSNSLMCNGRNLSSNIIIQKRQCIEASQNNINSKVNKNESSDNVKQPPSESKVDIQDTTLNHTEENPIIKNILETMGLSKPNFESSTQNHMQNCQLSSEVNADRHLTNLIPHSSEVQLSKINQAISTNCTSFRTEEESAILPSLPDLLTELTKSDNDRETSLITPQPVNPNSQRNPNHEESLSTLNDSSNLLCLESSKENLDKVLRIYQLYSGDKHSGSKSDAEISSPQNSNVEKHLDVPNHKILDSETCYDSSDNDECFDETNLNLDFGNVQDIIIGDGNSKPNSPNLNINLPSNSSSKATSEHLKLSYDALLDEVVHQKKEKNISMQTTSSEISKDRKRKFNDILSDDEKHQKAVCLEEMQNTDSVTCVEADNNSTLLLPKEISGKSRQYVKTPKKYLKYYPISTTENAMLNSSPTIATNDQNTKTSSPAIVKHIRHKLGSIMTSKCPSNTNSEIKLEKLSAFSKSPIEEVDPSLAKRKSTGKFLSRDPKSNSSAANNRKTRIELNSLSASSKSQVEIERPLLERRRSTGKSLLSDSESNTSAVNSRKTRTELKTLSASSKSQVQEASPLIERRRRSTGKSLLSDSESNNSADNNRTRKTTPKSSGGLQEKETSLKKRKKVTSEEERIPNISSRKISRTSKKKV